jgi:DNA segregation ATPase FtsK/SpoIIIE, S-DNA-T family
LRRLVHRPARVVHPAGQAGPLGIEAPPTLPEGRSSNPVQALLPVAGATSSLGMMLVFRNPAMLAVGALIMLVTVFGGLAMLLSQSGQAARQRRQQRDRYLEYLEELRQRAAAEEHQERAAATALDPPPAALFDVVRDPARRWERRRADPDFLRVRVGVGPVPARPLVLADGGSSLRPTDPFMLAEARAVERRFATTPQMPLALPLDRAGNVSVVGDRAEALGLVRALLVQAAAWHAPDDLAVALACPPGRLEDWSWAKWLPHLLDPERRDGQTEARRVAPSLGELARAMAGDLSARATYAAEARRGMDAGQALALARRLLVVHDAHGQVAAELPAPDQAVPATDMGVTVVHLVAERLHEPEEVAVRVTLEDGQVTVEDLRGPGPAPVVAGVADQVPTALAEGLARMLAPLRLSAASAVEDNPHAGPVSLPGMLGIDDPADLDLAALWAPRGERDFLRVPIGVTDAGEPLLLDLKEPAQLGMGPHGLCVGATGSGKSELLRTLVLALAVTHPPERLGMVLIDYKGGATFAPFAALPHVAGVITNLADDAGLVERVHASLAGEVQRRQQALKDAGNLAHIADYAQLRERDPGLAPLPHLLVIIDEFGELLTAKPEFIELFLTIGRIGRSIGVHLLLSSQRIEGGKLKGLDTYLSYRLGLRTFSAAESQVTLDTADAFHLPPLPGFGYLKVGTVTYERFKAAYVSGPVRQLSAAEQAPPGAGPAPFTAANRATDEGDPADDAAVPARSAEPGLHQVVVAQLQGAAAPVHRVWLPPLPAAVALDVAAGGVEVGDRGLQLAGRAGPMRVPLGLLDDPAAQRQGRWLLDLRAGGGHAAVIGGPQSGKTTLLRTLVAALALTHTPREVAVYGVDLVGGGLLPLAGFPHVGGVTGRSDRERVRRTFEEVRGMLEHREEVFRERGIDSVESLRRRHAAGEVPELPMAEVVLVVDGLGLVRSEHEELEPLVADLLQRGGGYGVHLVGSLLRWNDLRIALQPAFGTRLELRLNDPADSVVDRRLAATLRDDQPGRVLTDARLFAQAALPRIDGVADATALGDVVAQLGRAARSAWPGEPAPRVRVLPARLGTDALPGPREAPRRVPVGVDETTLQPLFLDLFDADQHLLALGDGECGKTNLLRLVAAGLAARHGAEELVFAVMDPRRGLRDAVPEGLLGGYAGNGKVCGGLAAGIAKELDKRMPEEVADPQALADGGWFSGPRIVVLVDDYDMLTAAGQQPLAPFLPYVPSARDIGLHFVVARRVAGASRALYDPFLQALRESGTSGLVMAGDRGEGQLFPGVYAGALPAGRGWWVRRGEPVRLVQTAVAEPAHAGAGAPGSRRALL